jgi:hypothetical protein
VVLQRDNDCYDCCQPVLEPTRCANTNEGPHQEAQVEATDVHDEPFQDVRVAAQVRAPQATGFIEMRVRAFESLTPTPLQRQPPCAANPSAVRVHRVAGRRLLPPGTATSIGLRNVGPQVERRQVHQHLIAGRVEERRGGVQDRRRLTQATPFGVTFAEKSIAPFPLPAHRTGRDHFGHPALGRISHGGMRSAPTWSSIQTEHPQFPKDAPGRELPEARPGDFVPPAKKATDRMVQMSVHRAPRF